jgi:type II secretory pathway pseudopilin PulG
MFTCPECESVINQGSEVCPFCGAEMRTASGAAAAGDGQKKSLRKTAISLAVLLAGILLIVWFALPLRQTGQSTLAESQAGNSLALVQHALQSYAAVEGHYPDSLEDLGGAVRAEAQSAQSAGYELQYQPGTPGADGRVHAFVLLARPSKYGYRKFFSDETGVIRFTRENRAATAQDPAP